MNDEILPSTPPAKPGRGIIGSRAHYIREAILENGRLTTPLSWADLARNIGVSENSVRTAASRLRKGGLLTVDNRAIDIIRAEKMRAARADYITPPESADVESVEIMSEREAVQRLSWTARYGSPSLRQDAQKRIIELARASGRSVGPQEPLTPDEAASRLASLMLLSGADTVREAIRIAFPRRSDFTAPPETSEEEKSDANA